MPQTEEEPKHTSSTEWKSDGSESDGSESDTGLQRRPPTAPSSPSRGSPPEEPLKRRRQKRHANKRQKSPKTVQNEAETHARNVEGLLRPQWAMHLLRETTALVTSFAVDLVQSLLSVLKNSILVLKQPLKFFLVFYIVLWGMTYSVDKLMARSASKVAELGRAICAIPLVPYFSSQCAETPPPASSDVERPINFSKTSEMQEQLAEIMRSAGQGRGLAISMKDSSYAVRSLATRVRVSQLTCKDEMGAELDSFFNNAGVAVRDLSRFGAKVASVVDSIVAIDKHALGTLQSIRKRQQLRQNPLSNPLRALNLLSIFRSSRTAADDEADLRKEFIKLISSMSVKIPPLVTHAERLLQILDSLEVALLSINDMAVKEEVAVSGLSPAAQQRGSLAVLWAKVTGKEHHELVAFQSHSRLLENVVDYQSRALEIVKETLVALQRMQGDLEEFQNLHSEQGLMDYPLEVHMESIRMGLARLSDARLEVDGRHTVQGTVVVSQVGYQG